MRDEGGLHGMQRVASRDAFDREDVRAVATGREREAGIDPPPVDDGPCTPRIARGRSLLGPGQIEAFAQQIEQRDPRVVQRRLSARRRSR